MGQMANTFQQMCKSDEILLLTLLQGETPGAEPQTAALHQLKRIGSIMNITSFSSFATNTSNWNFES